MSRWVLRVGFVACLASGGAARGQSDDSAPEDPPLSSEQGVQKESELTNPTDVFTFNPLLLVNGWAGVEYEHVFNPYLSAFAGPRVKLFRGLFSPDTGFGGGARLGVRWYQLGGAPSRLFTHLFADLEYFGTPPDLSGYRGWFFSLGAGIGFGFMLTDASVLSIGIDFAALDVGTVNGELRAGGVFEPGFRCALGLGF